MSRLSSKAKRIIWITILAAWGGVAAIWFVLPHGPKTIDASAVVSAHETELLNDPDTPYTGNISAEVVIVEFFDYNCSHCRRMAEVIRRAQQDDDQLRIIYKEFPILSRGSIFAARAALAAHRQGKYAVLHAALMDSREDLTELNILQIATQAGLDIEKLKADMNDPEIDATLNRNLRLANALKITATPTMIIGDNILEGSTDLESLQALVQTAKTGSVLP